MKGWKTFLFGLLTTVLGFTSTFDWTSVVNEQTAGYILSGVGVVTMILRALTDSPMFKKD